LKPNDSCPQLDQSLSDKPAPRVLGSVYEFSSPGRKTGYPETWIQRCLGWQEFDMATIWQLALISFVDK
jgi:hypothetical protein